MTTILISFYIWTLLVLLSEEMSPPTGLKGKSFKEKVLFITILFVILLIGELFLKIK